MHVLYGMENKKKLCLSENPLHARQINAGENFEIFGDTAPLS